MIIKTKIKFGR